MEEKLGAWSLEPGREAWSLEKRIEYQFERLTVWQKGIEFVNRIYHATRTFPQEESFGLTSQLRRAAVSIPVNIAEGRGRLHPKEYIQFLSTARGSLYEALTLIQVSRNLAYLQQHDADELDVFCRDLIGMVNGLIKSVRS